MSEEALQIAEERREAKSKRERERYSQWNAEFQGLVRREKKRQKDKGEKERHTHWNAEFQRIARRDKKALLSEQCKEI